MFIFHALAFYSDIKVECGNYHQQKNTMPSNIIAWLTVTAFVLFQFTYQMSSGTLIKAIQIDFEISAGQAGLLISSYYYIYAILQIPVGFLFDRFNAKYILTLGSAFAGLGCLLFASSHLLPIALLGRMTFGGGAAVAFVGMLFITRSHFPLRFYGSLIGLCETIGLSLSLVVSVLFANMIKNQGWQSCYTLGGIIGLLIAGLCFTFIPSNKTVTQSEFDFTVFKDQLKTVLRDKSIWLNGIYIGIGFSTVTVFAGLWATPFFQNKLNISLALASKIGGFCFLGAAIGCPLYGFLGSSIKNRAMILFASSFSTVWMLLYILYSHQTSPIFYEVCMFILGLICSSYLIAFTISDELSTTETQNTVAGFTNTLAVISAPIFQPLIGAVLDMLQLKQGYSYTLVTYQKALIVLPLLNLINCIILFYLPQRKLAPMPT